jgi:LmbE family N-acetylglucosaminyl deacetylase
MNLLSWLKKEDGAAGRNGRRFAPGGGENADEQLPELGADGPLTLMAIMAHPDDIDFGSAGSIARWCAEGWTVYYVLATSGDKGTHGPETRQELAAIREEEQRAAARVLGVKNVFFLGYPDGWLEPTKELRGEIVKLLRIYQPDVVLTFDAFRPSFNHHDHRNIGIAVRDALYPAVRDHLYYPEHAAEGLPIARVNELLLSGAEDPNYFVDVSAFIETKVDAMLCHASQVQTHDRDEMLRNMRERGNRRGRRGTVESFKRVRIGRPRPPEQQQQATEDAPAVTDEEPAPVGAGQSSS